MLLSTIFSLTFNVFSPHNMRDKLSHSSVKKKKIYNFVSYCNLHVIRYKLEVIYSEQDCKTLYSLWL